MSTRPEAGFTLVEMLMAMAVSAIVLTGAVAALNMMTEANTRASQRLDGSVGVGRALRTIAREVRDADDVTVVGNSVLLVAADGSAVAYQATAAGNELHRFAGSSVAAAGFTATMAAIDMKPAPLFSSRGHLSDASYDSSAMLQGITGVQWDSIQHPDGSRPMGLKVTVFYATDTGTQSSAAMALMMSAVAPDAANP